MLKIGRNDFCPCGSGKKFKKCHLGREDELLEELQELDDDELGKRITLLNKVSYGHCRKFTDSIDFRELTGKDVAVRFVDYHEYLGVGFNPKPGPEKGSSAGMIINPLKTSGDDPDAIYIAVTPKVDDSTLIHELAHVLEYLESGMLPGSRYEISNQTGIPTEHLDHTMEFAHWLDYLKEKFGVKLDAEDKIVSFLKEGKKLLTSAEIKERDDALLTLKSKRILRYLQEHREELMQLIQDRQGFIGPGAPASE